MGMEPSVVVEMPRVEKFVFDLLDRYGASFAILLVILMLTWKIGPDLAKVMIDKYRAETDYVREGQKVIALVPTKFDELKTALIVEFEKQHRTLKETVVSEADKRIEATVNAILRRLSTNAPNPDSDPPPPARSSHISRPG